MRYYWPARGNELQIDGHWHVTITLKHELPVMERILLQCALGSDPVRELLNWARVRKDDPVPILFIEPSPRLRTVREVREDNDPDDGLDVSIFSGEFDEPECLACECGLSAGRCSHMEQFQPALQFVRYGKD